MIMKVLFVYGTKYGSTKIIAEWIAERLGFDSLIVEAKNALNPEKFDLVIIGSGI